MRRRQHILHLLAGMLVIFSIFVSTIATPQPVFAASTAQASPATSVEPEAAPVPTGLALGLGHTCWVTTTRQVQCWGLNRYGQLGNDSTTDSLVPVTVKELANVRAVAAGYEHTCALVEGGAVWCWGYAALGQLGNGTTEDFRAKPVQVTTLTNAIALAAGTAHTCALIAGGTVQCWGNNSTGALGDGTTTQRLQPVSVVNLTNATAIAAAGEHTCAQQGTTLSCWGSNSSGELGDGTFINRTNPVPITQLANVAAIALGARHTCALLTDQSVRCWGYNYSGQIGDGTQANRNLPTGVIGINNAIGITAGGYFSCALLVDTNVKCWGNNVYHELGAVSGPVSVTPQPIEGLTNVASLEAGNAHACALLSTNEVMCWGWNGFGQTGDGTKSDQIAPIEIAGLPDVRALATGRQHACALLASGAANVKCWGLNGNGQLGDGTPYDRIVPTNVITWTNATAITAGYYHSCALVSDGTMKCWGSNGNGQLGDGSRNLTAVPVSVSGLNNVVAISAGGYHTCALDASHNVSCWGANQFGQLGDGSTTDRLTPTLILTNAISVAAGTVTTCAVLLDGTARCWGYNSSGQVGDGTTQLRTLPVAVAGLSGIKAIAPGTLHSCALLTSAEVSCWGDNSWGELGDGSKTNRLTPALVPGLTNVHTLDSGARHTCAVLQVGTARCWGDNRYGQLGDSSTEMRLTPVNVAELNPALAVASSGEFTCFALAEGSAACTGSNAYGQIGAGREPYKTMPGPVYGYNRVTVTDDAGMPAGGAEVWIYRNGRRLNPGTIITDALGRAVVPRLRKGDGVVALLPIRVGAYFAEADGPGGCTGNQCAYRVYVTSLNNGEATAIKDDGEQPTLVLHKTSPLILYDLTVSLEWCDSGEVNDGLEQQQEIRNGLTAASRYLFDVTDGQFAFGSVQIHDCAAQWEAADLQILASSAARPWAVTGGITVEPLSYTSPSGVTLKFAPGHIRMGRTWGVDGSTEVTGGNSLSANPPWFSKPAAFRALGHEFLHYAGFLFDAYFGEAAGGAIQPAACPEPSIRGGNGDADFWQSSLASAMYWPYNASELDARDTATWHDRCTETEQFQLQGESSWETLARIYADAQQPPRWQITTPHDRTPPAPLPGPDQLQTFPDLPVLSTRIERTDTSPKFAYVRLSGGALASTEQVQVYVASQNREANMALTSIDAGMPASDGQILIPGAQTGDVAIATAWDVSATGIAPLPSVPNWIIDVSEGKSLMEPWVPSIMADPLDDGAGNLTGIAITACSTGAATNIYAMLVPVGVASTRGVRLDRQDDGCYRGVYTFDGTPVPEAHLWVCRQDTPHASCDLMHDQLAFASYAVAAGSPGSYGRSYTPGTSNGSCEIHIDDDTLSRDAPILMMSLTGHGLALPMSWKLVSAPCLVAVPEGVRMSKPAPLALYYKLKALAGVDRASLRIAKWSRATKSWTFSPLPPEIDQYPYFVPVSLSGPGIYAIVASLPTGLALTSQTDGASALNIIKLADDLSVAAAFPPSCQLKRIYGNSLDARGTPLRYIPGAPDYVNTLQTLASGRTYYAEVGADCVAGTPMSAPLAPVLPAKLLPATYYGTVRSLAGEPLAAGSVVRSQVDGQTWGEVPTFKSGNDTVYVLDVAGDDLNTPELEGARPGEQVNFRVDGATAQTTAGWQPAAIANVDLIVAPVYKTFLPAVQR